MSVLNTISGVSQGVNIGGSALSLLPMGAALVKNLINKPVRGIEGFLFDIDLTQNVSYSAQITDHFTENNSAIQDHVAFDPLKITLTGKVAELVYTKSSGLAFLSATIDRLTPLGVLKPEMSLQARQYIAAADQLRSAKDTVEKSLTSLSDIFASEPSKNNQQGAFWMFEEFFKGRSLLSVETPWRTYKNMMIESWTADQDEASIYETTFTLVFKEMRFISTTTNTGQIIGRIKEQKAEAQDKGTQAKGGSIALTGLQKVGAVK